MRDTKIAMHTREVRVYKNNHSRAYVHRVFVSVPIAIPSLSPFFSPLSLSHTQSHLKLAATHKTPVVVVVRHSLVIPR